MRTSYFLTLTYDSDNVPLTASGFMTLCKRDLQLFFKSLRFAQFGRRKSDIKYYACGEYGGKSYRPHYHLILFNADLTYLVGSRDAHFVDLGVLKLDGKVPYKCSFWPHGHITVGTVTGASIGYTLKYMSKAKRIPLHHKDDRSREFSCMSKGLGIHYLSPSMVSWHKAALTDRMYCNIDGKKIAMPRYYKDKLYTVEERQEILIAALKKPRPDVTLTRIDMLRHSELKKSRSLKNDKI